MNVFLISSFNLRMVQLNRSQAAASLGGICSPSTAALGIDVGSEGRSLPSGNVTVRKGSVRQGDIGDVVIKKEDTEDSDGSIEEMSNDGSDSSVDLSDV